MCPLTTYPVLGTLFKPFRRSQRKTLAVVVAAIAETATTASFALAAHLAAQHGIQVPSALRRLQRLLANPRIRLHALTVALARLLARGQPRLLVALDWTEWPGERTLLVAAALVGTRAIPIRAAAFATRSMAHSQNAREISFVTRLAAALTEAGAPAVLLADRGFRRVALLQHLQRLGLPFVVRLVPNLFVHRAGAPPGRLRAQPLTPGTACDLGCVALRQDRAVQLRVVGIWATGQPTPWWLVTNLFDAPLAELAALYDRRMGIEEQFRDTKGSRFGVRLRWTQYQTPAHLARLVLLVGVAVLLWTAVGAAVGATRAHAQLRTPRHGPRLSVVQLGMHFLATIRRAHRIGLHFVQHYVPPPSLRVFAWLADAPT